MFIKYDEFELLELFANEPIEIDGKDAGIFVYKSDDKNGFQFTMYISVYEKLCCLTLKQKNLQKPIFDFEIHNVEQIATKENAVLIKQEGKEEAVKVNFAPNFSLVFE